MTVPLRRVATYAVPIVLAIVMTRRGRVARSPRDRVQDERAAMTRGRR
jgi:hypothetical protein